VVTPDQAQPVPRQMKAQVALCLSSRNGWLAENRVLRHCVAVIGVWLVGVTCKAMLAEEAPVVYVHPAPVKAVQ
jgi:hypothetical protein